MVSILHRYVARELLKAFAMSLLVLLAVMTLGMVYKPLRVGLSFGHVLRLLPSMLPNLLAWVVPAAMLAACVMSYGRLSADNELMATSVSGIPLRYMCYPALVLAVVVTAALLPLNHWLIPKCRVLRYLVVKEIALENPFSIVVISGQETIEVGDHKIFVESIEGDVLHNVVVIAPKAPEASSAVPKGRNAHRFAEQHRQVYVYRARRGRFEANVEQHTMRIDLQDAHYTIVTPGGNARTWLNLTADEQTLVIPMENPLDRLAQRRRAHLTWSELRTRVAELRGAIAAAGSPRESAAPRARLVGTLTEVHLRHVLSLATLALALVGVPLGIWIRRESKLASFAVALVVYLVLHALIAGGEGLASKGYVPPALALWTPNVLAAALGVGLLLNRFRH